MRRFGVPEPTGLMGMFSHPFDIKQPNIHNSKAEFKAELDAVVKARNQAAELAALFAAPYREPDGLKDLATNLCDALDENAKSAARKLEMTSPADVVRKIAAETDLSYNTAIILFDMHAALVSRHKELVEQEAAYWTSKGRAPNHYARTIALRFAKLVARHTGVRPTVGVSRDGNFPSTDFGRALEEIFHLLGIEAAFRRHAEWAVRQLTEKDLEPEKENALGFVNPMGGIFGQPRNALAEVAETLSKGDAP